MKRLVFMFAVVFLAVSVYAVHYYIDVNMDTATLKASDATYTSVAELSALVVSGLARAEITQAEYNAGYQSVPQAKVDAAIVAARTDIVDVDNWIPREKAFAEVLLDEENLMRQWITDYKAAVAAATSLADLQARIAALPDMPQRTMLQLQTKMATKLNPK